MTEHIRLVEEDNSPDRDVVEFLLSCGHYCGPVHCASSVFDFPDEVYDCSTCGREVQMDLGLQASLYAARYTT